MTHLYVYTCGEGNVNESTYYQTEKYIFYPIYNTINIDIDRLPTLLHFAENKVEHYVLYKY